MLLPLALVTAGVSVTPVVYLLLRGGSIAINSFEETFGGPRTPRLLMQTLYLCVGVTTCCVILGVSAAVLVVRTNLPARKLWAVLLALPLGVPPFVSTYAWVAASYEVAPTSTALFGLRGAVLLLGLALYPYVYLPVAAALRGMHPAQEEVARSLGHSQLATFFRITLPQLRPAIAAGGLVVALHMLAEYGALVLIRYDTLTTLIFQRYDLGEPKSALALSSLLTLLCLVVLAADLRLRGRMVASRVGAGVAREAALWRLGWWAPIAVCGVVGLLVLALGVPFASLAHSAVAGSAHGVDWSGLGEAAWTTSRICASAALLVTVLALPVSILAVRRRSPSTLLIERSTYVAHSLPGIVIALALVYFSARYAFPLYQSTALLVIAYAILFLPLSMGAQQAALAQSPPALEQVARSLGRRPISVLARVTLPLASRGIAAGALLVFLTASRELTATLLLRPTGMETLATRLWARTEVLQYAAAAPYAIALVAVSIVPAYLISRRVLS